MNPTGSIPEPVSCASALLVLCSTARCAFRTVARSCIHVALVQHNHEYFEPMRTRFSCMGHVVGRTLPYKVSGNTERYMRLSALRANHSRSSNVQRNHALTTVAQTSGRCLRALRENCSSLMPYLSPGSLHMALNHFSIQWKGTRFSRSRFVLPSFRYDLSLAQCQAYV